MREPFRPALAAAITLLAFASIAWGQSGGDGRDRSVSLSTVCPPITILPASLPGAAVGQLYSQTLTADGTPPYVFSVIADSLPPGLHVSGSGALLYGCDRDGAIFTINLVSGAGTATGFFAPTGSATEIEHDFLSGIAFAQGRDGTFLGQRFDLLTGAPIGGPVFDGASFGGLEYVGSTLYGTSITGPGGPSNLSILDPVTGATTFIGPTGRGPISGLAYDAASGTMYGIDGGGGAAGPGNLLTINLASGAATVVGPTGMTAGSLEFGPDGNLYAGGDATNGGRLYRVDRLTGAATLVGPTGFISVTGLTLGPGGAGDHGIISGIPLAAGNYPFTVQLTDANGCHAQRDYQINVSCPPIAIFPASLPPGTLTVPYYAQLSSDGAYPFNFFVAAGTLPPGLTLFADGFLYGIPGATGSYAFTASVIDAHGCQGNLDYQIVVSCPVITVSPASLPNAPLNEAYHATLSASGVGPHTFAVQAGSLPPGLTLDPSGTIDGTPTATGTFSFTVSATDSSGCRGDRDYRITVVVCPQITILPASLPGAAVGEPYTQTLTADGTPPYVFSVIADSLPPGLHVSGSGGALYGCDRFGAIFTVDLLTGAGTATGFIAPTGSSTEIEHDFLSGAAFSQGSDGTFFGQRFDLLTGAPIGGPVFDGASFGGLEYVGSTLYGTSITGPGGPSNLSILDPVTGATTFIGPTGRGPISGLAYDATSGTMYGIDGGGGAAGPGNLLTINLASGAATVVGPTGMTAGSLEFGPDGNLYAGGDASNGGRLYRVDRLTGAATLVGPTGFISVTGLTLGPGGAGDHGVISGIPIVGGDYSFTVQVTDANGCHGQRDYQLNVACPPFTLNPTLLPPGQVGSSYSQTLTPSAGTPPFTYSVSAGSLPPGLGLKSDSSFAAVISGTASAAGSFAFTVHAEDRFRCSTEAQYTIVTSCPSITLSPAALPDGAINVAYSQVLAPSAGAFPFTVAVSAGSLPPGLSLTDHELATAPVVTGARMAPTARRSGVPTPTASGRVVAMASAAAGQSLTGAPMPAHKIPNVLTLSASPGPRILFAMADFDDSTYRAQIAAITGGTVDYFNCAPALGGTTPSLALLSTYDCVFTKPNFFYEDRVLMGDLLADYVDQGHTVILGVFTSLDESQFPGFQLLGRIMTPAYSPVSAIPGTNPFATADYAGDGTTCIHSGVSAYGGAFHDQLALQGGGTADGHYLQDGSIAHAFGAGGQVIYSNGFGSLSYGATGDWPLLVANAATCIAHPGKIVIAGTPTQNGTFHFTLQFTDRYGCAGQQNFTIQVGPASVPMAFDLTPSTLNLASHGLWVTGFLEPAPPLAASAIDIASIRLNGTVPADPAAPSALGDHDGNGIPDLMVKFNRAAVELTLSEGDSVPVTVTGTVDGQSFLGTDYIRVRRAVVSAPAAGSHLMPGSLTQVRWQTPAGVRVLSVALLYTADGGSTWNMVAREQPNTGTYDWTVPDIQTDQAKVAVVLVESVDETGYIVEGVLGVSDAFSIQTPVGVGDPGPAQFALRGASPNPGKDVLQVSFSLKDSQAASVALYDVSGRQLEVQLVEGMGPGWHTVTLGGQSRLSAGLYMIRLTQNGRTLTRRAVLVR